jgi:hypothetical protein
MAWRAAHGTGADAVVRIETLPADELPAGVPGVARPEGAEVRGPDGRFRPGNPMAAAGGRAKAGRTRLATRLALNALAEGSPFAKYQHMASTFRRVQCDELAQNVGGGVCGPGPASIVSTAAIQLAYSRYFFDMCANSFDPDLAQQAAKFGDQSKANLLAAHELCAKEAQARARITRAYDVEVVAAQAEAETEARRAREREQQRIRVADAEFDDDAVQKESEA